MKLLAQLKLPGELGEITFPGGSRFNNLHEAANGILVWILGIIGALAVFAVIYSGFMYITSAGNTEQAEKAKNNLTWAIIGMVLVALAAVIVTWVQNILVG